MDVTAIMSTIFSHGLQSLTSEFKNWMALLNDSNPAVDISTYHNLSLH